MNILIPDSWLREHLKTKATPRQIAELLSLSSQSVEKVTKVDDDWVYEIEVTPNRADCLSIYGIARELAAILPRFDLQAKLLPLPINHYPLTIKHPLPLEVKIAKPSLCPRFTALIFDGVVVKPSPKIIQQRLEKVGIRALNNVVDISNYLMVELGQPMHTFDYDKIKGAKIILRESAGGEKITTLDGKIRPLPDGTIIIEDGERKIIDLCGIMGGANSQVDEKTKRVLLFIQTYDPVKIRQACQKLSFRTEAASRFEKGVDPEGVITAMNKAIQMFKQNCESKIASNLIDIYPNPPKQKTIKLSINLVNKIMGISIPQKEIINILKSLGFKIINYSLPVIHCSVPHWRHDDISIPEDLIEEIARIYGYHNLPTALPMGKIPQQKESPIFIWEKKAKDALKFWGFTETFNYSMISEQQLIKTEINPSECVKIANPLTEEWVYMRPSLIPSLLEVIAKNQNFQETISIFELANIYFVYQKNKLPEEILMLTGAINKGGFYRAKGTVEMLLEELGIKDCKFQPYQLRKTFYGKIFHPGKTAEVILKDNPVGIIGEINPIVLSKFNLKSKVVIFDLEFTKLVNKATNIKIYTPIPKYPAVIEDLCFIVSSKTLVGEIVQLIKSVSPIIQTVELIDSYKDTRTFRVTYQDPEKTLTDKEVEKIRKKLRKNLENKLGLKLKTKEN